MTILWTIIFGFSCLFNSVESLELDPVNGWTFTLITVIGFDLVNANNS